MHLFYPRFGRKMDADSVDLDLTHELAAIKAAAASHLATVFQVTTYEDKAVFSVLHSCVQRRRLLEREFQAVAAPRCVVLTNRFPPPVYTEADPIHTEYTLLPAPEYLRLDDISTGNMVGYLSLLFVCVIAAGLLGMLTGYVYF